MIEMLHFCQLLLNGEHTLKREQLRFAERLVERRLDLHRRRRHFAAAAAAAVRPEDAQSSPIFAASPNRGETAS